MPIKITLDKQESTSFFVRSPREGWVMLDSSEFPATMELEDSLVWVLSSTGFKQDSAEEQLFLLHALVNDISLQFLEGVPSDEVDYLFKQVECYC